MIKEYFKTWLLVISSPAVFFAGKENQEWFEEPLNFLGITALIFAFFATLIVFLNQYIPMGAVLIEGIKGVKLLFIFPVVVALAFAFFALTFLVMAGCMLAVFIAVFYGAAVLIYVPLRACTEKKVFFETVKASFYSSAAALIGIIPILLLYFVKKGIFTFSHFMLLYYIVLVVVLAYFYRLLGRAATRLYPVPKSKVLTVTLIPILILLTAGAFFGLKILPKLAPLII